MKFIFNPFTSNLDATASAPSDISGGTPDSIAGFDSNGVLESIPGFSINAVGGPTITTSDEPASNPNETRVFNAFYSTVSPSIDTTQLYYQGLVNNIQLTGDFDFDANMQGFSSTLSLYGAGSKGNGNTSGYFNLTLGDGTNVSTSQDSNGVSQSLYIAADHTANNINALTLGTTIATNGAASNVGLINAVAQIDGQITNSGNMLNLAYIINNDQASGVGFHGAQLQQRVEGDVQYLNVYEANTQLMGTAEVANSVSAFRDSFHQDAGTTTNGVESFTAAVQFVASSDQDGGYTAFMAAPSYAGNMPSRNGNSFSSNSQHSGTMDNAYIFGNYANFLSGSDLNGTTAFIDASNTQSGADVGNYTSASFTPNFQAGSIANSYSGLQISPNLNTNMSNVSLLSISPNGSGVHTNVTGLSVNLSGLDSSNRMVGLNVSGGILNVTSQVTTQSSIGVDSINLIIPMIEIESGSPITGTTVFGHNLSNLLTANDDFGPGALGPSLAAVAFVSTISVASGKTVSGATMAIGGAQVSGAGTVSDLTLFSAFGALNGGGTPTVTNLYGFKDGGLLSGLATNAWGLHISDANVDNFVKKLAINTATEKATEALDVVGNGLFSGTLTASNLSGTNTGNVTLGTANGLSLVGQALSLALSSTGTTGALSSTDWNTFNSKAPAGSYITALTGDGAASGPGSAALTLATVNSNVGTFGSATQASQVTVNAKGLVTAASNVTVTPAVGSITGLGTGVATFLATPSSANLASAVTDETGSGSLVFATSPTLVTPALGTPSAAVLTNATGLPISTGVSGLASGIATFLATPTSANLAAALTDETGTGANVFANSPTLVTPALGTPSSAVLTNATGLPISTGVSGLATGIATFLATPSSANLAAALTDETGSGSAVFATSPTLVTPALGTPSAAVLTNATGLPLTSGVTGTLPIANGGTGQTSATAAFNALSPMTTGGDIIYGGASGAATRLANGSSGQVLTSSGGTSAPTWTTISSGSGGYTVTASKTANYSATNGQFVPVSASGGSFTITAPAAAANATFAVYRTDQTLGNAVTISGTGLTTVKAMTQHEVFEFISDGTSWFVKDHRIKSEMVSYTPTFTGFGTPTGVNMYWRRIGDSIEISGRFICGTATAVTAAISLPSGLTIDTTKRTTGVGFVGGTVLRLVQSINNTLFADVSTTDSTTAFFMNGYAASATVDLAGRVLGTFSGSGEVIAIQGVMIPITDWAG